LTVEDLGSTNGTYVNGSRIGGPRVLEPGDRVEVGGTTLEVVAERAERPRGLPPFAPAAPPQRASGGRIPLLLAALAILALALAGLTAYLLVDRASGGGGGSGVGGDYDGVVYIESNQAGGNANSVLAFRYRGGSLRPLDVTEYPSGGAGSADLTDSGVLDADQQLIVNRKHTLLFAVNQGSDSIAVFHIRRDGSLDAVSGSPFPSGAPAPASLGLDGDILVVVDKAQDGIRDDLKTEQPAYTTFKVAADGRLRPTGSAVRVPPGSSPTQALIAQDHVVISTEEAGPFRAFHVNGDGALSQGPNSPLAPDASLFPPNFPPEKKWGLGLGVNPSQRILYAQMATVSKVAVYSYDAFGRLTFIRSAPNQGSVLPCWTLVSKDGRRMYTANAGNNTLSVFDIGSDPRDPRQLQTLHLRGSGNPWNITFDSTGKYIFMVEPRAVDRIPPGGGQLLHTLEVNDDGTVTEPSYSPVPLPVALNTNPIGIAAVARR
jgi:hypothetical protein